MLFSASAQHNSSSPFLRLPAEIRNQVYNYVIGGTVYRLRDTQRCGKARYLDTYGFYWSEEIALSQTCRQLHHETCLLPFQNNMFESTAAQSTLNLEEWMELLQPYQANAIQSIYWTLGRSTADLEALKSLLNSRQGIKKVKLWFCYAPRSHEVDQQVMEPAGFKPTETISYDYNKVTDEDYKETWYERT